MYMKVDLINHKNWKGRLKLFFLSVMSFFFFSCNYLDIVPDNVATIDNAFSLRSQTEKYLFTCYSYLPTFGFMGGNPSFLSGDEIWFFYPYNVPHGAPPTNWEIARGNQGIVNPYMNFWGGERGGKNMFQGIRDCNIFLENVDKVPDIDSREKIKWAAEVKFLKAYFHWYLLRMYGPIPIVDENMPISADIDEVAVYRQPVDSCFTYVVNLIDEAAADLPDILDRSASEMGRITRPIALAIKARVLMTAASPLFNGNEDYSNFADKRGISLFNSEFDENKWQVAADACREAIDAVENVGAKLYHFNPEVDIYNIGPELKTQMDIRNAICEKWNSELIWGASNSLAVSIQSYGQASVDPSVPVSGSAQNGHNATSAPPLKIAEMFYTKNGVPIDEDIDWDYENRYDLRTADEEDYLFIKPGYTTSTLNFEREPRFYADLGFDGGTWYGQGRFDQDNMWHLEGKLGQYSGRIGGELYSITGYHPKKIVNFINTIEPNGVYTVRGYPWPIIRLADLYLYYAEALNEIGGPSEEVFHWIDLVRERAGIAPVKEAWTNHSKTPGKFETKDGLREIIHHERLIEMAFEGGRYWDLRRWKEAKKTLNEPIFGWDIGQQDALSYYQPILLFNQSFSTRDYLWPIKEQDLIDNKNLVQNPGW